MPLIFDAIGGFMLMFLPRWYYSAGVVVNICLSVFMSVSINKGCEEEERVLLDGW